MKTKINRVSTAAFVEANKPARLSVSRTTIFFNRTAAKLLSIKLGSKFELEIDGHKLYYLDTPSTNEEAFSVSSELKQVYVAKAVGAQSILQAEGVVSKPSDTKEITYKFEIGELKEGRRLLTLIQ